MVTRTRRALFLVAALGLTVGIVPSGAPVTQAAPRAFVSGWLPYWQTSSGAGAITGATSRPLVSDIALFGAGSVNSGLLNAKATAEGAGIPVFLTWATTEWSGFSSAGAREATASSITQQVVSGGYVGADIDFEFVFDSGTDGDNCCTRSQWDTIKPAWVSFVALLSSKLHTAGKLLSVTVPPVWNGGASGYTVYAQDQIHLYVDQLRLMVYDWSVGSPGGISPKWWVDQVMDYSQRIARVPTSKLVLGLPAYGRHWWTKKTATETCPSGALKQASSVTMKNYAALAAANKATLVRDATTGEVTFAWDERVSGPLVKPPPYVTSGTLPPVTGPAGRLQRAVRLGFTTCTVRHVVSVADPIAVRNSADKAYKAGWRGISLWAFGYETAGLYTELAKIPLP